MEIKELVNLSAKEIVAVSKFANCAKEAIKVYAFLWTHDKVRLPFDMPHECSLFHYENYHNGGSLKYSGDIYYTSKNTLRFHNSIDAELGAEDYEIPYSADGIYHLLRYWILEEDSIDPSKLGIERKNVYFECVVEILYKYLRKIGFFEN